MRIERIAALVATLSISISTFAHHDASNDADQGEQILWQGTVRQVSFDGAHVMYRIEVPDAQGHLASWQVLGASPRSLAKRGIRKATIAAGSQVTVAGYLNPFNKLISPVYLDTGAERYYVGYFRPDGSFMGRM